MGACPHNAEAKTCNTHCCPKNCEYGTWSAWSSCSKSCGEGSMTRTRSTADGACGGAACPHHSETAACNKHSCPLNCDVGDWEDWSTCTKSCETGSQTRTRL